MVAHSAPSVLRATLDRVSRRFSSDCSIQTVLLDCRDGMCRFQGCYSQSQAEAVADFVPRVAGMDQPVGDRAAIEFAVRLYDAIGSGNFTEVAFEARKVAMAMSSTSYLERL